MKRLSIHLGAAGASALWASAFVGGKYALSSMPPLHLAGYRLLAAGLILLIVLRRNPWRLIAGKRGWVLLLSLFQTIIVFSAFNYGLMRVPGSFGAIIIGSSPAVTSLNAVIMLKDERMTPAKAAGLLVGFAGILLLALSREPWNHQGRQELFGAGLLMVCNISSAFGSILMRRKLGGLSPLAVNTVQMLFGGMVLLVSALLLEQGMSSPMTLPLAGSVIYLAFVTAVAVSIWLFLVSLPQVTISALSMWKLLIPALGPVFSWIFLTDDTPSAAAAGAMAAIAAAILLTLAGDRIPLRQRTGHRQDGHAILHNIGE